MKHNLNHRMAVAVAADLRKEASVAAEAAAAEVTKKVVLTEVAAVAATIGIINF
jgi:hypothetical protein